MDWVEDDEAKVFELLKGAYDRGLNTWDTANVYSNGGKGDSKQDRTWAD